MGVGNNTYGEFGLGDKESRDHPTRAGDDSDWIRVAAGDSYSLAVKRDGAAWAWGYGGDGQLGLPDTDLLDRPTRVPSGLGKRRALKSPSICLGVDSGGRHCTAGSGASARGSPTTPEVSTSACVAWRHGGHLVLPCPPQRFFPPRGSEVPRTIRHCPGRQRLSRTPTPSHLASRRKSVGYEQGARLLVSERADVEPTELTVMGGEDVVFSSNQSGKPNLLPVPD